MSKYKRKMASRSAKQWSGVQNLTSLLSRADGAIKKDQHDKITDEDIASLKIANKYKL